MRNVGFKKTVIEAFSKFAESHNEGDYTGEDGLIYCGNCHTRKQTRINMHLPELGDNGIVTVYCTCKCREKAIEEEQRIKKNKEDMERVEKLRKASLIDEKFRESTFDAFTPTEHNQRVLKFTKRYSERFDEMASNNQGLLLYGAPGTGKTFAAACIANYLLDRQVPVVMTSFVKLLSTIKQYGSNDEDEETIIKRINRAKLLIIDDLGAERSTDTAIEKVYNIVDSRYRARLPMILTTNMNLATMQNCGDIRYMRIYDRIFEVCFPIEFRGPSWRCEEAEKRFSDMKKMLGAD
ncbi:MAG: ATP-binding protein [Alphaproteobacteria bacterium]|nr:ATP-binding protein [Alphaproteobacteria bacterium]